MSYTYGMLNITFTSTSDVLDSTIFHETNRITSIIVATGQKCYVYNLQPSHENKML